MKVPPETNPHFDEGKPTHSLREGDDTKSLKRKTSRISFGQRILWFMIFLAGILVGVILVSLFLLFFSFDRPSTNPAHSPSNISITAEISRAYLTSLITKQVKSSSLPGNVSNVQVTLAQDNLMTVSGDDQIGALGLSITKHFTLTLQMSVITCQLHVKVIHADLAGIPVTGFAALFEGQLNQQLQSQQSGFPSGFTYCLSGVETTTDNLLLLYTATPTT